MSRDLHHSTMPNKLVLVEVLERNHVDLDPQTGGLGRIDALEDLRQAAPAGDIGEFLFVQRVKRHIHAPHPGGIEVLAEAGQLASRWLSASVLSDRHCPDGASWR